MEGNPIVPCSRRDTAGLVTQPVKTWKGFHRAWLRPGIIETVEFTLGPSDLSFRRTKVTRGSKPGRFILSRSGSSAPDSASTLQVPGDCP